METSEDGRKNDQNEPADYATAEEAISAIIMHAASKRSRAYGSYDCTPLNASAAARAIENSAPTLSFNGDALLSLDDALSAMVNGEAEKVIRGVLHRWADEHWHLVSSAIYEEATGKFRASYFSGTYDKFCVLVERWPRLKNDAELRDRLLRTMARGCVLDSCVPRLRILNGDLASAKQVMAIVMAAHLRPDGRDRNSFKEFGEFASLIAEWASEEVWGQLQHLLWRVGVPSSSLQTVLRLLPDNVTRVAALLVEFGIRSDDAQNYQLSDLSQETRASWRRELKVAIGDDPALRDAATEALLWLGPTRQDRAVLFAVLEIHDEDAESAIQPFCEHPSQLVRRRAHAVIDMIRLEPDATDLVASRRMTATSGAVTQERPFSLPTTWIGDARIEQLIATTLRETAQNVAAKIDKTLPSGEEALAMFLFERLNRAFESITKQLSMLAIESGANERLSLKLDYRIVGKQEEGAPGIGSKRFSADICLIFEAREAGRRFAHRASLIQAKRLYRRKSGLEVDYYPCKTDQLEDLAGQTMASFLLLLGPASEGVAIPVIPARLLLDLVERGESATQIAPSQASRLGKDIATWLVQDVIGLWTGDWDEEVVKRAAGGPDREPFILAELIVERIPKGPDGWGMGLR